MVASRYTLDLTQLSFGMTRDFVRSLIPCSHHANPQQKICAIRMMNFCALACARSCSSRGQNGDEEKPGMPGFFVST